MQNTNQPLDKRSLDDKVEQSSEFQAGRDSVIDKLARFDWCRLYAGNDGSGWIFSLRTSFFSPDYDLSRPSASDKWVLRFKKFDKDDSVEIGKYTTLASAKKAAEKHWRQTILKALSL